MDDADDSVDSAEEELTVISSNVCTADSSSPLTIAGPIMRAVGLLSSGMSNAYESVTGTPASKRLSHEMR